MHCAREEYIVNTIFVDERFFRSEYAAGFRQFARCGECRIRSAPEYQRQSLMAEEAANLQWVRCAQCRAGTVDWFQR